MSIASAYMISPLASNSLKSPFFSLQIFCSSYKDLQMCEPQAVSNTQRSLVEWFNDKAICIIYISFCAVLARCFKLAKKLLQYLFQCPSLLQWKQVISFAFFFLKVLLLGFNFYFIPFWSVFFLFIRKIVPFSPLMWVSAILSILSSSSNDVSSLFIW